MYVNTEDEGGIAPESSQRGHWEYIVRHREIIINNQSVDQRYFQPVWCPTRQHPIENAEERLEIHTRKSSRV